MQLHYRGSKYVNFIWHSSLVVLKDQASKLVRIENLHKFIVAIPVRNTNGKAFYCRLRTNSYVTLVQLWMLFLPSPMAFTGD